jgi:hypothetical protein
VEAEAVAQEHRHVDDIFRLSAPCREAPALSMSEIAKAFWALPFVVQVSSLPSPRVV